MFVTLCLCLCMTALAWAAVSDVLHYRIPDAVHPLIILSFLIMAAAIPLPWVEIGWRLMMAGVAFTAGLVLFAARAMGGGDVKLLSAILLWFPPAQAPAFLLLMSLLGGAAALIVLARARTLQIEERRVPYGVAIAGAAAMQLLTPAAAGAI
ncbi:prepilin peptidase [Lacibacterium aquatile]|uniref:Prepilin peptidase n=1 Tax=Lacibacterium aquatile TaxID=1168082 RepID=A0ABW5DTL1_9PROT